MSQDEGMQEEKFDFTRESEVLGYISLDQARVLAMRTAREAPGADGRRCSYSEDQLHAWRDAEFSR
mgnify:CR=1 FL=1